MHSFSPEKAVHVLFPRKANNAFKLHLLCYLGSKSMCLWIGLPMWEQFFLPVGLTKIARL